jgi:hypothetical protein
MVGPAVLSTPGPLATEKEYFPMTTTILDAMRAELKSRMNQAFKAADLLRSAAERLDTADPDETRGEQAARLRGSSVLAHTAALELAATSGWVDALATVEQHDGNGTDGEGAES